MHRALGLRNSIPKKLSIFAITSRTSRGGYKGRAERTIVISVILFKRCLADAQSLRGEVSTFPLLLHAVLASSLPHLVSLEMTV